MDDTLTREPVFASYARELRMNGFDSAEVLVSLDEQQLEAMLQICGINKIGHQFYIRNWIHARAARPRSDRMPSSSPPVGVAGGARLSPALLGSAVRPVHRAASPHAVAPSFVGRGYLAPPDSDAELPAAPIRESTPQVTSSARDLVLGHRNRTRVGRSVEDEIDDTTDARAGAMAEAAADALHDPLQSSDGDVGKPSARRSPHATRPATLDTATPVGYPKGAINVYERESGHAAAPRSPAPGSSRLKNVAAIRQLSKAPDSRNNARRPRSDNWSVGARPASQTPPPSRAQLQSQLPLSPKGAVSKAAEHVNLTMREVSRESSPARMEGAHRASASASTPAAQRATSETRSTTALHDSAPYKKLLSMLHGGVSPADDAASDSLQADTTRDRSKVTSVARSPRLMSRVRDAHSMQDSSRAPGTARTEGVAAGDALSFESPITMHRSNGASIHRSLYESADDFSKLTLPISGRHPSPHVGAPIQESSPSRMRLAW